MTSDQRFSLNTEIEGGGLEDHMRLKEIFSSFYRNKNLISKFILSGLIFSALIAFSTKRTWQGRVSDCS